MKPEPAPMYALVDCNNFYASCEQVFNPRLEEKPLAILSNNDGCIIARSQKAKDLGIQMGEPAYLYRERARLGELNMLSSNFTLYADMSQRVMQTLSSFSSDMEIYSIDEAFFILEDAPKEKLEQMSIEMRKKVKQWTGIPISIGVAPTKTLAKAANRIAKKGDGVFVMAEAGEIEERLSRFALEDVWGIGKAISAKLKRKGIYTAGQLRRADDVWIRKLLGVTGFKTVLELRGTSCIELEEEAGKKKSIVCSRSFSRKIEELDYLLEAAASFATRAAEKLRGQESLAGFISVFASTSPFEEPYESGSCHIQLPYPTAYTPELISLAKEGLKRIFKPGFGYKKAGVLLGDFSDKGTEQKDLLAENPRTEKKERAMEIVDRINEKYDRLAVRFAAEGVEKHPWQSLRANSSPKFTTSWHELLRVK